MNYKAVKYPPFLFGLALFSYTFVTQSLLFLLTIYYDITNESEGAGASCNSLLWRFW